MKHVFTFAVITALSGLTASPGIARESAAQAACPVSQQQAGLYGNDGLSVGLWRESTFVFEPGGPGFIDRDGALGMKVAWHRHKPGKLHVSGRRLDATAASARAYIYDYGSEGFQPSYLVFPTPGCWEITGKVADATLTFVVRVQKIGAGPRGHLAGPPSGFRVTS